MSGEDLYHIICLKRSRFVDSEVSDYLCDWFANCKIVYWMPGRRGYTEWKSEAGMYSMEDLKMCCGEGLDWFLQRIPRGEEE